MMSYTNGENDDYDESHIFGFFLENATTDERRDFLDELSMISALSNHENIVNLIAACTRENGEYDKFLKM